jgi:hypothetical protein
MKETGTPKISPPFRGEPKGWRWTRWSITFQPAETRTDLRAFARAIFGRWHVVLWIIEDPLGDFYYARVWHGLNFHLLQADLIYGYGELFGRRAKLRRLYRRHERRLAKRERAKVDAVSAST